MRSPFRKGDVVQNRRWEMAISDANKLRFRILSSMLRSRVGSKDNIMTPSHDFGVPELFPSRARGSNYDRNRRAVLRFRAGSSRRSARSTSRRTIAIAESGHSLGRISCVTSQREAGRVRRQGLVGTMERLADKSLRIEKIYRPSADRRIVREHRDHGHFRHC
jgi:hypothetical protein